MPLGSLLRRLKRPRGARVDRVAPWLLIGPALDETGYRGLVELGVTHVVDLREEASDDEALMARLGLRWRRLPILDRRAPADVQVDDLIAWWTQEIRDDAVLYLHCHAGYGRTPTVAIALLMCRAVPLADAHRQVRAARPGAQPSAEQDAFLEAFARRLTIPHADG